MSTPSTTRSLADISTPDGVFSIIAMDQRNTLRRMFSAVGIDATDADLVVAKTDVARALTPLASGILFDPTYGVPAITGTGALAETCGLLVASEPAERGKLGVEPITRRDPALDSRWVLSQGGDANKFFAQLRADDGLDLVEEDPGLARRVTGGGCPDGCGVGVVAQMQDHVVSGRTGSGDLEAGRQGPDIECGAVQLLSLPRGCDTEQPEHAAQ